MTEKRWFSVDFKSPGFFDTVEFYATSKEEAERRAREYAATPYRDWPYVTFQAGGGEIVVRERPWGF